MIHEKRRDKIERKSQKQGEDETTTIHCENVTKKHKEEEEEG